jgi:anaerobic ribonucleoside-triphosphate reductase activating protein
VIFTGYTYEELQQMWDGRPALKELLDLTDYLIDGRYIQEQRDLTLQFRGSRNQRIIDMNATREAGIVVLSEKYQ